MRAACGAVRTLAQLLVPHGRLGHCAAYALLMLHVPEWAAVISSLLLVVLLHAARGPSRWALVALSEGAIHCARHGQCAAALLLWQ